MNKKFSTLVAALLLSTTVGTFAQTANTSLIITDGAGGGYTDNRSIFELKGTNNKISSNNYNDNVKEDLETIPEGYNSFSWGYKKALEKADNSSNVKEFFSDGFKNVLDMWFGVLPVVMCLATLALVIAEYTTIFQVLGTPFIPILKLLQVPEAAAASQTLIVGFADMLLPSVLAANTITSEMTKFIIACVSVTQLVYMSEVGGLLLGSKIPVNLKDLILIFLERTLVTLPIIVLIANFLF